jgi:predicted Zn-dependent protease
MNSSAMMHFYLALVYQKTSRNDEALAEFKHTLRWDPKNFPANLLLGRMYIKQQKAEEAIPSLKKCCSASPRMPLTRTGCWRIHIARGGNSQKQRTSRQMAARYLVPRLRTIRKSDDFRGSKCFRTFGASNCL